MFDGRLERAARFTYTQKNIIKYLWGMVKFHTGGIAHELHNRSRAVESTAPTVKSG